MSAVGDKRHATEEEIVEAIDGLTDKEHVALRKKAAFRARSLGRFARGCTGEDLLHEAMTRTLLGVRSWPIEEVDFPRYLDQAMRSIVGSWRKSSSGETVEADTLSGGSNRPSVLDQEADPRPDPEAVTAAVEELKEVERQLDEMRSHFASDREASEILAGWGEDLTGPDIRELAGITKKEYEVAVKRIRYYARSSRKVGHA